MLSERTTTREVRQDSVPFPTIPYTAPGRPQPQAGAPMDGRQRSAHLTAMFGTLAMMEMRREG